KQFNFPPKQRNRNKEHFFFYNIYQQIYVNCKGNQFSQVKKNLCYNCSTAKIERKRKSSYCRTLREYIVLYRFVKTNQLKYFFFFSCVFGIPAHIYIHTYCIVYIYISPPSGHRFP
ncbi:polyubiquitin 5, partial [Plasmodium vivax India VII]